MIHQFDHRWATYDGDDVRDLSAAEKQEPLFFVMPRYWVEAEEVEARIGSTPYLIGFRDIARSTDERTAIMSLIASVAVGHKAPLIFLNGAKNGQYQTCFLANVNSFIFDYLSRQKVGGTSMTFFIVKQLVALSPDTYTSDLLDFIVPRVLELAYTAWDLQPFARDLGYMGHPFRWDDNRRFMIRCELDALYFHLYQVSRADTEYIMDTFPIVRRKDEAMHGYYRTKEMVLSIFDRISNDSYVSPLDPPAGDPRAAHPQS